MFLLRLALLNIKRNPRRSAITLLSVGVGLAALMFLWGFADGTTEGVKNNIIKLFTGHIQIHARGFDKKISAELVVPDLEIVLKKLRSLPQVVAVTERVKCEALIGTTENTRGILLIGIDPARESKITTLKQHILEGAFIGPLDKRSIMIGDLLADKLNVKLKDKVVIMTQAYDGTLAGFAYKVDAIFHTGSRQVDQEAAFISLPSEQELLGIGKQVHEIVISLSNRDMIPSVVSALRGSLDPKMYEILPWSEIVPEPLMWVSWYDVLYNTFILTVMLVVGMSIMNTMLMAVFERTKELGIMMAIGTSPGQIVGLILCETILLEFGGIILGLILGYSLIAYFGHVGIAFHGLERALSQSFVGTVIYTWVSPEHVIRSVIYLVVATSFVSAYPALRAARTEPVKAIYHS